MSREVKTATIPNADSISNAVEIPVGMSLVAVLMPAAWTAASLTFQGSHDESTFRNLFTTAGSEMVATAAVDRWIVLDPADFIGLKSVKVRSGTSGTPVVQGAERALLLVMRVIQ